MLIVPSHLKTQNVITFYTARLQLAQTKPQKHAPATTIEVQA